MRVPSASVFPAGACHKLSYVVKAWRLGLDGLKLSLPEQSCLFCVGEGLPLEQSCNTFAGDFPLEEQSTCILVL